MKLERSKGKKNNLHIKENEGRCGIYSVKGDENMVDHELSVAITRNEKGNLYGTTTCNVCNKQFEFEENVNSDVVAIGGEYIPINNVNKLFVQLNITSKCPFCGYKVVHYNTEKNETIK